ncbi:hypothetical protein [Bacillus paranthracis]|uniref:hypothetical protein n=1 Tax=Bacillus paranthracis TaxID=2026186 RepID=UPI002D773CED|nr:hypothetical protein [Bacillus paranthracis]
MKLNLELKQVERTINKGDVLVFKKDTNQKICYYLVVEDMLNRKQFALVNLATNNIMGIFSDHLYQLVDKVKDNFENLEFVEVITAEDLELKRKYVINSVTSND